MWGVGDVYKDQCLVIAFLNTHREIAKIPVNDKLMTTCLTLDFQQVLLSNIWVLHDL